MEKEITFNALRCKEVVNITDGRRLGKICDLIIETCSGRITGIITPGARKSFFKPCDEILIPWHEIDKIGDDVILVCLGRSKCKDKDNHHNHKGNDHHSGCGCDDCLRLTADWVYHRFNKRDRCDDHHHDRCDKGCDDHHHDRCDKGCDDHHHDRCDKGRGRDKDGRHCEKHGDTYYNKYDDRGE